MKFPGLVKIAPGVGLDIVSSEDGRRMRLVLVSGDSETLPLGELTADTAVTLAMCCLLAARFLDQDRAVELLREHGILLDGHIPQ